MRILLTAALTTLFLVALAGVASAQTAISCSDNAQSIQGGEGTTALVTCPAGCGSNTAWGTAIYSDDSSICTAAIHAGAISSAGGTVAVTIIAGQPAYQATTQNGVTTSQWGQWNRSFTVAGAGAMALSCSQNAQGLGGDPGTMFAASCPAGCGSSTIWGTGVYSDDSSICSAAIHAGVITTAGGSFHVTIAPGQSAYPSSAQNGITSSQWGSWGRSFTVSP